MNYFSSHDMVFALGFQTPNTTTQTLFSVEQTMINFDSNTFWPQWGTKPLIEYYRLLVDE